MSLFIHSIIFLSSIVTHVAFVSVLSSVRSLLFLLSKSEYFLLLVGMEKRSKIKKKGNKIKRKGQRREKSRTKTNKENEKVVHR
jgi:hypothetical protein